MSLRLPQILFVCPEGHCQNTRPLACWLTHAHNNSKTKQTIYWFQNIHHGLHCPLTGPERDPRCDSVAVQKLSVSKHLNPNLNSVLIPCRQKTTLFSQFPILDFQVKSVLWKSTKTSTNRSILFKLISLNKRLLNAVRWDVVPAGKHHPLLILCKTQQI